MFFEPQPSLWLKDKSNLIWLYRFSLLFGILLYTSFAYPINNALFFLNPRRRILIGYLRIVQQVYSSNAYRILNSLEEQECGVQL